MALIENQLTLKRLMICNPNFRLDEAQLALWDAMSDEDILVVVDNWKTIKRANPNTTQGLIAKITALEE